MRTTTCLLLSLLLSCSNSPAVEPPGGGLPDSGGAELPFGTADSQLAPADVVAPPDAIVVPLDDRSAPDQLDLLHDLLLDLPAESIDAVDITGEADHQDLQIEETMPPPPAWVGEMCSGGVDCADGSCVGTIYGDFCLPHCFDGLCPFGWQCAGSQPAFCVPFWDNSCAPCLAQACPVAWCRELGDEGSLCLQPCLEDTDCETGFSCVTDDISAAKLCQPASGSCFCREEDMEGWIPCQRSNEFGTCVGNALCLPERGRQKCQAMVPEPDICDGQDNDCDGFVDENFPLKGKPCDGPDPDDCHAGKYQCAPGGKTLACEGDISYSELCNGKDDDCDGLIDEDFPNKGKPCGVSPLCGIGHFVCSPQGLTTFCGGVKPAKEVCDGLDNDCDGKVDEGFKDSDGDGVADCVD